MKVSQGDIIELNYLFPNGIFKPHLAIIVSNDDLLLDEGFFYVVMLSSKNYNPQYTFELKNEMLTRSLQKQSYAVCQLIGGYTERDVLKKCGRVKEYAFVQIVEKIKQVIF
ncbi:MAG: type II toxin-antitoxin system PemK/MazF family toxin [Bacteroidales bacterium]|jgi:mRNA-degrading endonuclease toxin of MazEF toxin-antitoxin module|nr:type II toxin-antitoxin system PemK/MazF family toxin [Bacteroidales bacterium]